MRTLNIQFRWRLERKPEIGWENGKSLNKKKNSGRRWRSRTPTDEWVTRTWRAERINTLNQILTNSRSDVDCESSHGNVQYVGDSKFLTFHVWRGIPVISSLKFKLLLSESPTYTDRPSPITTHPHGAAIFQRGGTAHPEKMLSVFLFWVTYGQYKESGSVCF